MTDENTDEKPRAFLLQVRDALLRVAALFVMGLAHRALSWGLHFVVPPNIESGELLLEDVAFLFFGLIYVYLSWDMAKVFIPWLQAKPYPTGKSIK